MKNESRASLLKRLGELSERYPHWRFGQMLTNVSGWADADIWDAEDEQLLEAVDAHLAQLPEFRTSSDLEAVGEFVST